MSTPSLSSHRKGRGTKGNVKNVPQSNIMVQGTRKSLKLLAGSLGFLPALTLAATSFGLLPSGVHQKFAALFLLPTIGVSMLAESFQLPPHLETTLFLLTALLWSCFLGWVCWKYTAMLLGEDELGGRPFDWTAWRLRFFIGFIIGFLIGWRFARNSDGATIIIAMIVTGVFGGLILGAKRENFWQRPL
jgi:hypothetical protein